MCSPLHCFLFSTELPALNESHPHVYNTPVRTACTTDDISNLTVRNKHSPFPNAKRKRIVVTSNQLLSSDLANAPDFDDPLESSNAPVPLPTSHGYHRLPPRRDQRISLSPIRFLRDLFSRFLPFFQQAGEGGGDEEEFDDSKLMSRDQTHFSFSNFPIPK